MAVLNGVHELASPLPRRVTQQLAVADRGPVAGGQDGLFLRKHVGGVVELVERAAVAFEHATEPLARFDGEPSESWGCAPSKTPSLAQSPFSSVLTPR